jgi:predicted nucleic acid-binding protein
VRTVVVDANVFVSFFIERHEAQRAAARELLQSAEDGEIAGIVPQSVVFEVAYVLQSQYAVAGDRLATIIRAVTSFPGVQLVDECPWKRVLEIWPDPLSSLADAAIVAVATAHRYDAVATFDRKLANRLESFGLAAYW